jgi:hypothetical protein
MEIRVQDLTRQYNPSNPFDVAERAGQLSNQSAWDAVNRATTFNSAYNNYSTDYFNSINAANNAIQQANEYNASSGLDSFLDDYDSDYFDPDTYINLDTFADSEADTSFGDSVIDNSYGGSFDAGLDIGQTFDYLNGVDINSNDFSNYDASTQFAAQDISTFDEKELDILKSVGAIDINEDGAVSGFNSGDALRKIEDQLIEYRGDLSDEEIVGLTSLRNEILAAEDLGLDSFSVNIEDQPSTALAGEGGQIGLLGTNFSNRFLFEGDEKYKDDGENSLSGGYLNEGNANKNSQIYGNTGGKFNIYGEPVDFRTNPALQGMQFAATPNAAGSIIQGVDTFTDYLRDGAGLLLKPLNWISDGVGGGLEAIGGAFGNNPIGRGISGFGNIIDNTGDYLFGSGDRNSLLGTVFNVPDNIVMAGVGGLSGNWDVAKQGLKGLVAAPFELIGNTMSVPLAVAKDVFGVDDIKVSASAGGGGGGGRGMNSLSGRPPPQRKRIGNVLSSGGGGREGITSVNGSKVGYGGNEYDMSTPEGQRQLLSDSDFGTLADAIAQTGGTSLLSDDQIRKLAGVGASPSGPSSGTASDPIGSSDVDRSSLAKNIEEKQGGGQAKVKKTTEVETIENIIDKLAKGSVRKTKPAPVVPQTRTSTTGEDLDIFDNNAPTFSEED